MTLTFNLENSRFGVWDPRWLGSYMIYCKSASRVFLVEILDLRQRSSTCPSRNNPLSSLFDHQRWDARHFHRESTVSKFCKAWALPLIPG